MEFGLCLVQMPCIEGEREKNFQEAERLLLNYKPKTSCDFILLPELFAIGFRFSDYQVLRPGIPGPTSEFVEKLAVEKGAYVVTSGIEAHGAKFYNTLVIGSPEDGIIAQYRKIHPFQDEREVFDGGDTIVLFQTREGLKVGVEICYDIRFPEVSRTLALEGADLILIPAAFPEPRRHHWDTLVLARAIENQLFVAATNRVGSGYDGKKYFGHSQLVDPWGQRLNEISSGEQIVQVTGNTERIHEARSLITCFEDRSRDGYNKVQWYERN